MFKDGRILICKNCQNFPLLIECYDLKQIWECQVCGTVNEVKYQTKIINQQLTLIDDNFWIQYQKNINQLVENTSIIFIEIGNDINKDLFVRSFTYSLIQNDPFNERKRFLILRQFDEIQGVYIRNNNLKGFNRQCYQKRRNVSTIQYILLKINQYIFQKVNQTNNKLKKCQIVLFNGEKQQIIDFLQLKQGQINLFKNQMLRENTKIELKSKQQIEQSFQKLKNNKQLVQFFKRLVTMIYTKKKQCFIQKKIQYEKQRCNFLIDTISKNKVKVIFYCEQFRFNYYQMIVGIKTENLSSTKALQRVLKQKNIDLLIYSLNLEQFHQQNKHQKFQFFKIQLLYQNKQKKVEKDKQQNKQKIDAVNFQIQKQSGITQDQFIIVFYSVKYSNKTKSKIQTLKLKLVVQIKKLFINKCTEEAFQTFKNYLTQKQENIIVEFLQQKIQQKLKNNNQKHFNQQNTIILHRNNQIFIHKIYCLFYNIKLKKVSNILYVFDWNDKIKQNFQNLDDLETSNLPEQFSKTEQNIKSQKLKQQRLKKQQKNDEKQQNNNKMLRYESRRRRNCLQQISFCQILTQQSEIDKYKNSFKKKKVHPDIQTQINRDKLD